MRKHYLDNLRWSTVVLVVLYHVIYIFNGVTEFGVIGPFRHPQYQDGLLYLLHPWFMILLFVISGICARYALARQTPKDFLRSRTRKLLVPSTLGLLVFHWIGGYFNMTISHAFETMPQLPLPVLWLIMAVSGTGVLWYIQTLWLYSALLVLLRKLETGRLHGLCARCRLPVLLLLLLPAWGFAQLFNLPITVYRLGLYGFSFFTGYFVLSREEVTDRLRPCWLPLSLLALGLGLGYTFFYFGKNYAMAPIVNNLFSVGYGWLAMLAALSVGLRFGDKTNGFCQWMHRHSYGLYVFHYVTLSAAAWAVITHTSLPALPIYLLTTLSAFLGGYGLELLISRLPFLRWAVLGISGKEPRHAA